jgi:hypothetical protein
MAAAVTVAAIGIYLAWSWYAKGEGRTPARLAASYPGVYRTLENKYFVDEAYDALFVRGAAIGGGNFLWEVDADGRRPDSRTAPPRSRRRPPGSPPCFDQYVVDGLVNGVAEHVPGALRALPPRSDRPRAELRAGDGRRALRRRGGVPVVPMRG